MNSDARDHIVKSYDLELQRLTGEIVAMGELAVAQLGEAMAALGARDGQAARAVIERDDVLDDQERAISHDVLRLLALRQPAARDLREVLAALRIAADIERIGDYAVNICRRSLSFEHPAQEPLPDGLYSLAHLAGAMVRDVLQSWRERNAELAHMVWKRDDEMDARYLALFRRLLDDMMQNPQHITACTQLLFIAKNLERVGDHATNIAEDVWFVAKGEPLRGA